MCHFTRIHYTQYTLSKGAIELSIPMKKKYTKFLILTTIVFLTVFFVSCGKISSFESSDVQTDFEKDSLEGCDYAETIYKWEALYNSSANQTEACYHPYDDDYDESKTDTFIENYLREQEIDQKTPDGVAYNQEGYPFIEYYIDEEQHKYCFVIHLWADYWIDYEAGTSKYSDAIYCTTHILKESDKVGNLIYDYNEAENTTREQLYDELGKRMSAITYEYLPKVSFPFITQYWNLNTSYEQIDTALCRNQKTWFYKEQAQFDETGNLIGYQGFSNQQDSREYISFPSTCIYSTSGRLEAVQEELLEDNTEKEEALWDENGDSLGKMEFHYNENGIIEVVDYFRPPNVYGTTDSSGTIKYDNKGRMIYNEYYITHGSHINVYLYEEDTQRPWACFYWCSYAPGFEKIYLYQPVKP